MDASINQSESVADRSSVFAVIPTYNEAANIGLLIGELFALPIPRLQVVVVDDNSPDGTAEVAASTKVAYPGRVHIIQRQGKQGLGTAYLAGFRYALDHGADYVVQMDADFSHLPRYIPEFLQHVPHYDVVVGSRYASGGELDPAWGRGRYRLSRWANAVYVRLLLGLDVRDATGGFKCWSRRALTAVLAYPVHSKGFFFQVEMAYLVQRLGFSALEVPIFFQERRSGRSKMSLSIKLEAAWRTLLLRWRFRNRQPRGAEPVAEHRGQLAPVPVRVRNRPPGHLR
jgi:dolichol-phosphate mannosyltransferase